MTFNKCVDNSNIDFKLIYKKKIEVNKKYKSKEELEL